jgi:hypothetical protein
VVWASNANAIPAVESVSLYSIEQMHLAATQPAHMDARSVNIARTVFTEGHLITG